MLGSISTVPRSRFVRIREQRPVKSSGLRRAYTRSLDGLDSVNDSPDNMESDLESTGDEVR